ncbi:MAG: PAS domain S-box protein [Smithellaceae bacterium]|nr:PAS domain S-box protein [Smithellaceae bacterium]
MKNDQKSKQLVHELTKLHSKNTTLKKSTSGKVSVKLAAEEARRYAESIVEAIREPLLVLDGGLKIVSANRNFYRTFKVTPDETLGTFLYDLGNKQWDIPKLRELLEEVLPEKEAFDGFKVEHHFESIGYKVMLLNARQIHRKDIGTKMILLAIEDITERNRLEGLLIDSELQYRRLFETASDGIMLLEKGEGKITHANPAAEKLLGYTEKESLGNKLQDIGVSLDLDDFQTTMQNLNKTGIINYRNVKVETKSGKHIDTEIYLVDRAKLVQCNIRDITERKLAKKALRESEAKYRWLLDNMADVITVIDMDLHFTYVSPSIMRMRGYTAEEATAQTFEQVMTPESLQIIAKVFEEEMQLEASGTADPGRSRILDLDEYRKDGSIVCMENHLSFLRDEAQKAVGIISLTRDITERKRAEEEIVRTNTFLDSIIENIPDMIFLKDARELRFVRFNRAGEELLGQSRDDLIGKNDYDFFPKIQADFFTQKDRNVLSGKKLIDIPEEHIQTRGGEKILHTKKLALLNEKGEPSFLLGISEDITERKRAEEQLRQTLESLRKAVNTTIQVMVSAIEARDPYTAGHQIRSANLARAIATEMGLPKEKIDGIRMAGSIHDIGTLSIPSEILTKPTKLTNLEFSLIKEHSQKGFEILKDVESPWPLAQIVYQHHERMDGSGYPRQLKGKDIIIEARILAVADVVEAMASHRPYRPSLGLNSALAEIENNKGTIYDTDAVDACLKLFREKGFQLEGEG